MLNKKFLAEYNKLNPKQKEAVDTIEGPVMIIAGPGTGKTQIIAMRIANILAKAQVNPSNILALTFTNSGAYAMRKRLLDIVGPSSYAVSIDTFHSFCNGIINTFPEKFLTARRLNQLTDLEQILLVQEILDKNNFAYLKPFKSPYHYQKSILSSINKLKQENIAPENFKKIIAKEIKDFDNFKDLYHEKGAYKGEMKGQYKAQLEGLKRNDELSSIYKKYQKELTDEGKYDYADMILFVLAAFKNDPDILSYYQEKYQYVLVDEYQDTNSAQNEIVRLLGSFYDNPNIFVVGDDEQSIFRFQGASLENILSFSKTYADTKVIVLKDNYRSSQEILDLSRALISQNENQIFNQLKISKNLKSQQKNKGRIVLAEFSSSENENYFLAREIEGLIKKGTDPNEIAVLYKEHHDVEELVEILAKLNIPYRLEVGSNILEDEDIKKVLNILKVLDFHTPNDSFLFEVMHYPFFNLAPIDIFKITRHASETHKKVLDIISGNLKTLKLKKPTKLVQRFFEILLDLETFSKNNTFTSTFEHIINSTGYLDYLLKLPDSVHHLNRLQILFSEIKKLNVHQKSLNIKSFLKYLDDLGKNDLVIKDSEIEGDFSGVNLMTAHKAKGLEFENVFLIKLIDKHWGNKTKRELIKIPSGILSIQKNTDDLNDEEERRLFYVGLTRAKKNIYLTYATNYGEADMVRLAIPSKFLTELPSKNLMMLDTHKLEKNFAHKLELSFSEKKWHPGKELKEFIKSIIEKFYLSTTSFNSYLTCPKQFFLDHIIRVPKAKDFNQSYGTAVHKALENLFLIQIRDGKIPSKPNFIQFFFKALDDEILTSTEYDRAKHDGAEVLEKYYEFYKDEITKKGPPISCEYNFKSHNVHFGNVPITGKIDKIEMIDSVANTVRIVDYKTSKPKTVNELLGQTKNADKSYAYQAFFYKLLAEVDPLFKWKIKEIEFDFIQPDKGKFKKVLVPIDEKEYQKFKELVTKTYSNIIKMDFSSNKKACAGKYGPCEYSNLC